MFFLGHVFFGICFFWDMFFSRYIFFHDMFFFSRCIFLGYVLFCLVDVFVNQIRLWLTSVDSLGYG